MEPRLRQGEPVVNHPDPACSGRGHRHHVRSRRQRRQVIAPEVGGGFGCKLNVYPDEILCTFASKMLGSPVRWTETRRRRPSPPSRERLGGDGQDRGDPRRRDRRLRAGRAGRHGGVLQNFTIAIPVLGQFTAPGQYDIPNVHFKIDCVYTNTPATDAYRGGGRPEAAYYLERSVDALAAELDMDPADLRRRNYVKPEDFPFTTKVGMVMDSGQYAATLDRLLEMADIQGLRAEQTKAREKGRYLGIGLTTYVENCGLLLRPCSRVGLMGRGRAPRPSTSRRGAGQPRRQRHRGHWTGPTGQGHETTWAQIASDTLGVPFDRVKVRHGDTHDSPMGIGTFGSRSAAVGGPAVARAAGRVQEKAARIAAHMLEAAAEDIRFEDGKAFVAGSPEQSVDGTTWSPLPISSTSCPRGWRPAWRMSRSIPPTPRGLRGSPSGSRGGIRRRATSSCCGTWRWTTVGR